MAVQPKKKLAHDNSNRPPIGKRFKVIKSTQNTAYSEEADRFVGKIGTVRAYRVGTGVHARFEDTTEDPVIPYEQCEWKF